MTIIKRIRELLAGPFNVCGSKYEGHRWSWFVEWRLDGEIIKRIDGWAVDTYDVINQQRAVVGMSAIDN